MMTLTPVLLASLLGSLHCVGMCGGLVGFYAGSGAAGGGTRWAVHAAYHLTRLIAYAMLGASAGGLGAALDLAGRRVGLADLGALSAAAVILVGVARAALSRYGCARLIPLGRGPRVSEGSLRRLQAHFATMAHRAARRPPIWRASALGLSSALLPCGWLYAFVVLAAGAGSASVGALLLAAFWSGTVPALLGLGIGVERLSQSLRVHVPKLSAGLLVMVALFNIASRWPLPLPTESQGGAAESTPSCHAPH